MASPPRHPPSISPPYPQSSTLPRKRPLPALSTNQAPYPKKPRNTPSFSASSSTHPLRQTSFPPEEREGERSPSIDSVITTGTGARSVGPLGGKKKRRKRKGAGKEDGGSVRSGAKGSASVSARGVGGRAPSGRGDGEEEEGEEEEEMEGEGMGGDVVDEGAKVDEAYEQRRMNVLVDAFSRDQSDRYDIYRRVKLKTAVVRRIVNQTLSQSVPPTVITSINGFAKVFLGTLIERAREIQEQEVVAAERSLPTPPQDHRAASLAPSHSTDSTEEEPQPEEQKVEDELADPPFVTDFRKEAPLRARDGDTGPLLPDHVREAFRRFKRDGEGIGAGVEGRSVGLRMAGAMAVRKGRRMFK